MISRGVLDIGWHTLVGAAWNCLRWQDRGKLCQKIEQIWDAQRYVLVAHSVRSGLDAVLAACCWPRGSEVLVSAVTIPDIVRVLQGHGLVPVPIDVRPDTLAPDAEQVASRVTPLTRAILVAHLFGSRIDLAPLAPIARGRGIQLWEDVAQGMAADGFAGSEDADVSFFSFGIIKHQTSLGGALVRFQDSTLADRTREVLGRWNSQPRHKFALRILRCLLLSALTTQWGATAATLACSLAGRDADEWLSQSTRGYSESELLRQLRQQPCAAQLALLHRRLAVPDRRIIERKAELNQLYREHLLPEVVLGSRATFACHWVLPIVSQDRQRLRQLLYQQGYDGTYRASQLTVVASPPTHPDWTTPLAADWVARLFFLPLHPALQERDIAAISQGVKECERIGGGGRIKGSIGGSAAP